MTTRLAEKPMEELIRKRIGEIPILQTVIQRLRLREILLSYIKPHGNETVPAIDTLLVLVWNIACGRQPMYELPEWVAKLDGGLLGHTVDAAENSYGDDRFARALDKLYAADRASMVTDIALRVIETTGVDVSELHNDSTTVKSYGHMPGKTATGLYFAQGHSKDHRPDLKQIVYNLTISADLILQAVIAKEVRRKMKESDIDALSIHPEQRLAYHPTTAKIFERFQDISHYRIVEAGQVIKVYRDEITNLQKEILGLLGMTEKDYWLNLD